MNDTAAAHAHHRHDQSMTASSPSGEHRQPATPRKRRRSEENAIAFYYARSNPTTPLSATSSNQQQQQQQQQQHSSLLRDVLSPSASSSSSISSISSSIPSSPATNNIDFILPPLAKRPHSLHRTWTAPTNPFVTSSPPSAPSSATTTTTSPTSSPAVRPRLAIPFSTAAFTQPHPQHKAAYSIQSPNVDSPTEGKSSTAHTPDHDNEHEHAIAEEDMDMNLDQEEESSRRPTPPPDPSISRTYHSAQTLFPEDSQHIQASTGTGNTTASPGSTSTGGHSSSSASGSATPTLSTPWKRRFADDKSPDALSTSTPFPSGRRVTLGHSASAFLYPQQAAADAAAASGSSTATSPPHYHTYHRYHSPPVFGVPAFASRVSSPPLASSARAFTTFSPAYSSTSSSSSSLSSLSPPSTFTIPQRRTSTSALGHASAFGTAFSRSLSAQDLTSATTAGLLLPPPLTSSLASRFTTDRVQQAGAASAAAAAAAGLGPATSPSLLVSPPGTSSGTAGALPPEAALASGGGSGGTGGAAGVNPTYAPLRPSPLIQSHTLTAVNESPPARAGSNSSSSDSVFVSQQQQRQFHNLANSADGDMHSHVSSSSRRMFDDSSTALTFRLGRPPKSRGGTSSGHRSSIGTTAGEDSDTASLASDMGTDDALGPEDSAVSLPLHQNPSMPSSGHNSSSTEMPDITVLALGSAMDSDPDRS